MAIVRGVSDREKQRWQDRESRRRFDQQRKPGAARRRGKGQRGSAFSPFFRIADRLGLKAHKNGDTSVMEGTRHTAQVKVVRTRTGTGRARWQVTIHHDRMAPDLALAPESVFKRMRKLFTGDDLQTGDKAFDDAVHITGSPAETLALLRAGVRKDLGRALDSGAVIRNQALTLDIDMDYGGRGWFTRLRRLTSLVVALLPRSGPVEQRLIRNALADTHPGTRLANVRAAWQLAPESVLERRDHLGQCPLIVAWFLHELDETVEPAHLRDLDAAVADPEFPADLRAWACGELAEAPMASRSAGALAVMLASLDATDVRIEIARQLEQRGDRRAVELLVELSSGLFRSSQLKEAARRAVASIMRRTGSEQEGTLTLTSAGEAEGGLSDVGAVDGVGEVSLSE